MLKITLHTKQKSLMPKEDFRLTLEMKYRETEKKTPKTQRLAGTYKPIKRLNGTSKHIVKKAMTQTVLKIRSSKEKNLGSPIIRLPLSCFPNNCTNPIVC